MALNDNLILWLRGFFGTHNSSTVDVDAIVRRMLKGTVKWEFSTTQGNALVNIAATYFHRVADNISIKSVYYVPRGTLTANATNYAILNLLQADGAGGSTSVVANITTQSTNMADGVPYALTVQTANVDGGQVLAFQKLSIGAGGVALPLGHMQVDYEQR